MEFKGALIRVSETTLAIIEVSNTVLEDDAKAASLIKKCSIVFPRVPIVLVAYDVLGKPIYYGKKQITRLLINIHPRQIPWKKYILKK